MGSSVEIKYDEQDERGLSEAWDTIKGLAEKLPEKGKAFVEKIMPALKTSAKECAAKLIGKRGELEDIEEMRELEEELREIEEELNERNEDDTVEEIHCRSSCHDHFFLAES